MVAHPRFFNVVFGVLLTAVVLYYGVVHWRVICLVEPATARETAFVSNIKGFLDPAGPRPYSLASLPGHTNVYGMGYLWGAAPFASLLPYDKLVNLRIANTFYLGLMLLAMGYGCRKGPRLSCAFGLVLVYALFVSSPSIAAGPDILACLLYVLGWIVVAESGLRPVALALSIVFGFLALLTKPYLVLLVPAIGSYLFLFRSIRSGLLYTASSLVFFGAGLWLIHRFYPYYITSVFGIHLAATSRDSVYALRQWGEFFMLAAFPFFFAIVVGRRWLKSNAPLARCQFGWSAPVLGHCAPINVYAWGAIVAVAALAFSLAWHKGAYLIYFWHLLLPLLVLSQLRQPPVHSGWLCINLLILLVLRPPLPLTGVSQEWRRLQDLVASHHRMYLDPYLQALRLDDMGKPDGENAQSEYILALSANRKDEPLQRTTVQFLQHQKQRFVDQSYDGILLTQGIFYHQHLAPTILEKYRIARVYQVYSYYHPYQNRLKFGQSSIQVFLLEPILQATVSDERPNGTSAAIVR